jgi:hypothetical protein
MIVSEYCSICGKKTFRQTSDCDCQETPSSSDASKCIDELWNYINHMPMNGNFVKSDIAKILSKHFAWS